MYTSDYEDRVVWEESRFQITTSPCSNLSRLVGRRARRVARGTNTEFQWRVQTVTLYETSYST
jgi:hypothetical protein